MALMTGFGLFVASVLTAALSKVVAEDFVAWSPRIVRRLLKIAVARLPENHRERFAEEWQSHVDELPGITAKVFMAAGCLRAAHSMALSERRDSIVDHWMQTMERVNTALSKSFMMVEAIQADTMLSPHDRDALVPRLQSAETSIGECEREANRLVALLSVLRARPTGLIEYMLVAGVDRVLRSRLELMERGAERIATESDKIIQSVESPAPKLGSAPQDSRSLPA